MPLHDAATVSILRTPPAFGGLSLLCLHIEALLLCISGLLDLPVEGIPFCQWSWARLLWPVQPNSVSRVFMLPRPLPISFPLAALRICGALRIPPLHETCWHHYCPWLTAPLGGRALNFKAGLMDRIQFHLLLGWYHLLIALMLRHAMRTHCRLPLHLPTVRCASF